LIAPGPAPNVAAKLVCDEVIAARAARADRNDNRQSRRLVPSHSAAVSDDEGGDDDDAHGGGFVAAVARDDGGDAGGHLQQGFAEVGGVAGVHGDVAELAADRRLRLARHAIDAELVTVDDLRALDAVD
jgi:hypothetical protein